MIRQGTVALWRSLLVLLLAGSGLSLASVSPARAAGSVSLTTLGGTYSQDFNTLASAGTASTVPIGWDFTETGTNANSTYTAGTGSNNAGDTYSFGTAASDRAFGGLQSGSLIPAIGASFTNSTGGTITSLNISYTGEQWRLGTSGRGADRIEVQYSSDATSLSSGSWTAASALNFSSPVTVGTVGLLNGNIAANRTAISASVSGLSIPNGATFWLRWIDFNVTGADDGLAVDDFSLTPLGVAADTAPSVASTDPAGGASDVLVTSPIVITFSEPVSVSGSWFDLNCALSGSHTATVSGGPISYTLDPSVDFANGENCTVTIIAAQVSDQDANDPPDSMAANYVTSFSTIGPDSAPVVASTIPADGATNVPLNQNVIVTFSEPVNVTEPWFSIACATSGAHAATVSGGPTSYTLNPTSDFVFGELCTLVIDATKVRDQDNNDPPDTMVFNFVAGFTTEPDPCTLAFTPASSIQGSGATAALTGIVTTQGVVVGDFEYPGSGSTANSLRGFYLQDLNGDGNPATSDAIFIFNGNNNSVALGDIVRVTGTAGEFQDQTQLSNVTSLRKCGTGSVAPVDVTLPFASATAAEQYEGMLVRLPQTLYVTEHFQLGRFGQVLLSAGNRLAQPTNVTTPGASANALQAQNDLNQILLDDASQAQNPDPILFGRGGLPLSASNTLRGGDSATGIVGVMTYTWAGNAASGNAYRVRPINALGGTVQFEATNPRPVAAPARTGSIRVAGMNLLNFFNTFDGASSNPPFACTQGVGGALVDCRGADDASEFARQWPKTVSAILGTSADIVGVIEMENDGYGPTSAIAFLVDQLNAATAAGTYAFIDVDANTGELNALGSDAIKVGLIYKPSVVGPVGQTAALNSVAFVNGGDSGPRSRPALAQAFQVNATGARFVVSVNHFKSKGSACDLPDAGDGQGNCNAVRTQAANLLTAWLTSDPTGTGDTDTLILGDLNSYAKEDPITAIEAAGFTNLIAAFNGPSAYSFAFDGQWGYLDYALGSSSLVGQINTVGDWHINADEPNVLDYNDDFKSVGQVASLYAPAQFRISDHDPVLVDLTPNAPPTVAAGGPYALFEGGTVNLAGSASDPDLGDTLSYAWSVDSSLCSFTDASLPTTQLTCRDNGSFIATLTVNDGVNPAVSRSAVVSVGNLAPTLGAVTIATALVPVNTVITASAPFSDPGVIDTHTAVWDWGDLSTSAGTITESNGSGTAVATHSFSLPGVYPVLLKVTDKDQAVSNLSVYEYVVVYDPTAGFVTGSGSINSPAGALIGKPLATGRGKFGFNTKYKKNGTLESEAEFELEAGAFHFHADNAQWLVISGAKGQFQGIGTVEGSYHRYSFTLTVIDGQVVGGGGIDKYRLRIWDLDAGNAVVYDNENGASLLADPTTLLSKGEIKIKK